MLGVVMQDWLEPLLHPLPLALLGLCFGSFLNVVVHRLPLIMERESWASVVDLLGDPESHARALGAAPAPALMEASAQLQRQVQALPVLTLSRPSSRCPHCGAPIAWHDNLPVLGWLKRRGRCAACGAGISLRYPLVEGAAALLFAGVGEQFEGQLLALLWCAVVAVLLTAALIDWDTTLLPDSLTLPLLWAGLIVAAMGWTVPLAQAIWGAAAGYLVLWTVNWLFRLLAGQEGMGGGDFKLLAALGAWLGVEAVLPILLAASVLGAVVGLAMEARGALRMGRYVPFGPFLAGAGLGLLLARSNNLIS
jgi:leader peptidase (prepilin peptidase)/N-methyltransferase